MNPQPDIRWLQRFQNLTQACALLAEALDVEVGQLSRLEQEGVAHRFEYCFELAWKTMKDFLEAGGITLQLGTPRAVIKIAFESQVIEDGAVWLEMLDQRNLLTHTYDQHMFEEAVKAIAKRYLPAMLQLLAFLKRQPAQ